MTKTIFCS